MLFPEFYKHEINSMKASEAFFKGLPRRLFKNKHKKIFVIGFHKTGTSSLGKALQILGFTVCGSLKEAYNCPQNINFKNHLLDKAKSNLEKYQAFQDTPWFLLYKELYQLYPDAYFILTIRDTDRWLNSIQKHFGKGFYHYHREIYGSLDAFKNANNYKKIYEDHNTSVINFFSDKGNFKVLKVGEFNWDDLCLFLDEKKPFWKFPHTNKSSNRGSFYNKMKMLAKQIFYGNH